jgi:8-oxo-dGTP diphosphatase
MTKYVAGLLFSVDRSKVALIKKDRPVWQKGRLNAIGGKIEPNETPLFAMRREFIEETGVDIPEARWELAVKMKGLGWELHFYRAWGYPELCKTQDTSEPINVFDVKDVKLMERPTIIGNLNWLISLCLDVDGGIDFPVTVNYQGSC